VQDKGRPRPPLVIWQLRNMPLAAALARAEVWRRSAEELRSAHGHSLVRFTVSLGIAGYPEHGTTPDDATRSADQVFYRTKAAGRNGVLTYRV
jgi:diguanylate cyclase (GGDEF)-like protein